jgi:hypothetical protein
MASLENQKISESYKDLLQVSNSNSGIDGTARVVSDGEDTASKLYLDTSRVGVGELAPTDGLFHIHEGSAGSVTAHANGDELVLESDNSEVGMSILGSTTSNQNILFGDPDDHKKGYITYAHNGDTLILGANADHAMKLDGDSQISLSNNDSGTGNTIFGHDAATPDSGGDYNIAIGEEAAKALTTGDSGVYIGTYAGTNTNTGSSNVAIGYQALNNNTDKNYNLAIGGGSLYFAQGHYNTGIGYYAGRGTSNYSGTNNISIGYQTAGDISGSRNVCIGDYAGHTGTNNLTTGVNNVLIGTEAEVSGAGASNQIAIGYLAEAQADNSVTLGNENVTAVYMAQDSGAVVYCSGVNFPDTPVESADVNTLDDYEEGLVTDLSITFGGNSASQTYNSSRNQARYTKVGNRVFIGGYIELSAKGSSTGAAKISGLPFTIQNHTGANSGGSLGYISGLSFADFPMIAGENNTTNISFAETTNSGTTTTLTEGNFTDSTNVIFSFHYNTQ